MTENKVFIQFKVLWSQFYGSIQYFYNYFVVLIDWNQYKLRAY